MSDQPQTRAKHESGAVVREDALRFTTRPDGTRYAARADGSPMRILTGDRTTGKLHIGHWVGSLKNRVRLQHLFDTFILMADVQALTTHYDRPEVLRESVWDVALDYLAAGIDPDKASIVVQSMVPAIDALTVYYGLLVPVGSLTNNPTVKTEAEAQGFTLDQADEPYFLSLDTDETVPEIQALLTERFPETGELSWTLVAKAIVEVFKIPLPVLVQAGISVSYTEHSLDSDFAEAHKVFSLRSPEALGLLRDEVIKAKRAKGFNSVTYGFLGYPISQAADITFVDADLVPVGPDQVPLIELCREVVDRFNHQYGSAGSGAAVPGRQDSAGTEARPTGDPAAGGILRKPQALLGTTELIRGIDGSAKMSKSQGNAIYLSDSDERVWELLRPAPTDPQRVRKTDPGRPELCNIFAYHATFCGGKEAAIDEAALGVATVAEVAENCRGAKWGCIDCKKNLHVKLAALLDPMRERRAQWAAQPHKVKEILLAGTARAQAEGERTLKRVRSAMHMRYFD